MRRSADRRPTPLAILAAAAALLAGVAAPAALATTSLAHAAALQKAEVDLAGDWGGQIDPAGQSVGIIIHLTRDEETGEWSGTLDIPQQSTMGLPLESIEIEGNSVRFAVAPGQGGPTFEGEYDEDSRSLAGTMNQGGAELPFRLSRDIQLIGAPRRPQDPRPPLPYEEQDVTIDRDGFALAGTLTLPKGDGPVPAVVLLTGSGPQDRNSEVFDHRPFLVLADQLTRRGVAVLRLDDRGVGESTGSLADATYDDLADDALAAIAYLRQNGRLGPIGLLGHSEGGAVAPRAAVKSDTVDFVILLAGPAVAGHEMLVTQNRRILLSQGKSVEEADRVAAAARALFEAVLAEADTETLRPLLRELVVAQVGDGAPDAAIDQAVRRSIRGIASEPMRRLLSHDPGEDLEKLHVPVLAFFGELDVQVDAAQNEAALKRHLAAAELDDTDIRVMEGLNHLFQPATTGAVSEYGSIQTTLDPKVIQIIADWIGERVEGEATNNGDEDPPALR